MAALSNDRFLAPILAEASNKIHEKLSQCRTALIFIDNVRTQAYRQCDSLQVNVEFDGVLDNFENMSTQQMKSLVQSYADRTARALRDSAANLQRVLSLQSKLTAVETANARIMANFDQVDKFVVEQLKLAAENESERISEVKEVQDAYSKVNDERKTVSKRLTDTTMRLKEAETKLTQLIDANDDLNAELMQANRQMDSATIELTDLRKQLEGAQHREEKLQKEISTVQSAKSNALNAVEQKNSDAERALEKLQKELKFVKDGYEKKLIDLKRESHKKQREIVDCCEEELRKCKTNAEKAISDAVEESRQFYKERNEFRDLYHNLLKDVGYHKDQNLAQMQADVIRHNRELVTNINAERRRTRSAMRVPIPNLPSPHIGADYAAELHSSTDDSGSVSRQPLREVNQVKRPSSSSTQASSNLSKIAKYYDVAGRFPPSRPASSRR